MKRVTSILASLFLLAASAFAQGLPAAQHTEQFGNVNIVFVQDRWTELFSSVIKMPEQKDLYVNVTIECGLLMGGAEPSYDGAVVRMAVTVDGVTMSPGRYEMCGKTNELSPKFSNLATCTAGDGKARWSECGMTEAQMNLLRRSTRTTTANFILKDVGVGVHTIKVKAYLWNGTQVPARAVVGDGGMMAEIIRLRKGD